MKKDLLNLINIDIDFIRLIFYRKITFFYIIAIFSLSCDDNVVAPTWYTTINLPLISTEILFSDIVNDCNQEDEESCNSNLSNQCIWDGFECNNEIFSLTPYLESDDSIITILFENILKSPVSTGIFISLK